MMAVRYPDKNIRNALISDASITQFVGHRVFNQYATPETPLPFIVTRRTGTEREQAFTVPVGVPRLTLNLVCYAATFEVARELADAVRRRLDGFGGYFDNTQVKQVAVEEERDELVQLAGSEKPPAFAVEMDLDIWWQET
jgi:hypothetical protein